ncbi:MAG: SDR family oxidoreductase, partial [Alphaproteobacteria bacterium]|nr:SDR family oxidoreductase [Alphaproteobacteria bacterium]
GVVVLKRLEDALADGDVIDAVILGAAVNNDGDEKAGYTAPGFRGQCDVVRMAQELAAVDAESIGYIEAHGTGTRIGDPLEISALSQVFSEATDRRQFAAIGSVKASIGHLDAAAGIVGLIKAILVVREGIIPPSVNFSQPNPMIDFAASPVYVATEGRAWSGALPRRAAVSSFGIGGTNAHVIIEQPPAPTAARPGHPAGLPLLLLMSAKSEPSLQRYAPLLGETLKAGPEPLAAVAANLRHRRRALPHRLAVVAADTATATSALNDRESPRRATGHAAANGPKVVLLFTGQGAQRPTMGGRLRRANEIFAAKLQANLDYLARACGVDLRDLVALPADRDSDGVRERLQRTEFAQPALVAVEMAIAETWLALGVEPSALLGHSIGEIAAAGMAGIFTRESALQIAATRGRLMQAMEPGSMLAVSMSERDLAAAIDSNRLAGVEIAVINGPRQAVLAGPNDAVEAARRVLEQQFEATCTVLRTSHAFHSAMMDGAVAPFMNEVARHRPSVPKMRLLSSVTGAELSAAEAIDAAHWGRNIRSPVRFAEAAQAAARLPDAFCIETGPGSGLLSLMRQAGRAAGAPSLATASDPIDEAESFARAAGALWAAGSAIDLTAFTGGGDAPVVRLPSYQFDRRRCWIDAAPSSAVAATAQSPRLSTLVWKRTPVPPAIGTTAETWAVLADDPALVEALAAALSGTAIRLVSFAVPGARDSSATADAVGGRLLPAGLASSDAPLARIVVSTASARAGDEALADVLQLGRELAEHPAGRHLELVALTRDAFDIDGRETIAPWSRAVAALMRVAAQESRSLSFRSIDLPAVPTAADVTLASRAIGADGVAPALGIRHGRMLSGTFVSEHALAVPSPVTGKVHALVGGGGRLGLLLARHLVARRAAKVAIVARSPMTGAARAVFDALRQDGFGNDVLNWIEADATDTAALANAFDSIEHRLGSIDVVAHLAGVVGEAAVCPVAEATPAEASRQSAPKIRGIASIARAIETRSVERIVLFSYLASLLGGLGSGLYAAANAYMDAFAAARHAAGDARWTSLAWDRWAIDGGEGITPDAGFALFDRAVASNLPLLLASIDDPATRHDAAAQASERRTAPVGSTRAEAPAPDGTQPDLTPAQKDMLTVWCDVFSLERIGIDDNFYDLGGDSVMTVQIVSRAKKLGYRLTPDLILEKQTIRDLAAHIAASSATSG